MIGREGFTRESLSWDQIDAKRRKTGGWWSKMNTLRVRPYGDKGADEHVVLEVNIHEGRIHGIRILTHGYYDLRAGHPAMFGGYQEFMDWANKLSDMNMHWEVWAPGTGSAEVWYGSYGGLHEALDIIREVFTT